MRKRVDDALDVVKRILDITRRPAYAADVAHTYEDKYTLAESIVTTGASAYLKTLTALGMTEEHLASMREWAASGQVVTLRFTATEECQFDKETVHKEESPTVVVERTGGLLGSSKKSTKVVTKTKAFLHKFSSSWRVVAFKGVDPVAPTCELAQRKGVAQIVTTTREAPKPATMVRPNIDVDITWLLKNTGKELPVSFAIDRDAKTCKTPRRNDDVDTVLTANGSLALWANRVANYFRTNVFPHAGPNSHRSTEDKVPLESINDAEIFVPVLPIFEKSAEDDASDASVVFSSADVVALLAEQTRSMQEKMQKLGSEFAAADSEALVSVREAGAVAMMCHVTTLAEALTDGVNYIEHMLLTQLESALGKHVESKDFVECMQFHDTKLYTQDCAPRPFCYAVRRPQRFPEGVVSIEQQTAGADATLARTFVRKLAGSTTPTTCSISDSAKINFIGDKYLHGCLMQEFRGSGSTTLELLARARPFSSFLVVLGVMGPNNSLVPKHAIVLKNEDALTIPLILETIPTPKEFRDAIESLSPEQQRFARAFRAMQLEGNVFGMMIVQIRPQLERLLRLPADSLTKEIRLTQDLMQLFYKYQIPADLLTFDGEETAPTADKISAVKEHVKNIFEMIKGMKEDVITDNFMTSMATNSDLLVGGAPPPPAAAAFAFGGGGPAFGSAQPMPMAMAMQRNVVESASMDLVAAAPVMKSKGGGMSRRSKRAAAPKMANRGVAADSAPVSMVQDDRAQPQSGTERAAKRLRVHRDGVAESDASLEVDFAQVPVQLDRSFSEYDTDAALRPTIVKVSESWTLSHKETIMDTATKTFMDTDRLKSERTKAFDLLDALSRSGALDISDTSLHVIVAATHCFKKNVVNTVIKDNINPIEKVERSSLIMASTVLGSTPAQMVKDCQIERLTEFMPTLMALEDNSSA